MPVIQPTLGLSVGHMRRSLSQKNRRRPPSVRIQIPEDQDLFRIPETRARSSSTGDADEETKVQAKAAAETKTKGFQRAKTVVCTIVCPVTQLTCFISIVLLFIYRPSKQRNPTKRKANTKLYAHQQNQPASNHSGVMLISALDFY